MTSATVIDIKTQPHEVQLDELSPTDFVSYYHRNRQGIEERLETEGCIKFCGVQIPTVNEFQFIVDAISDKFLSYVDGNSPRTKLSGNVYTSTEYDQTQRITMHNELSYSAKWPNKIFFSCITPSETGGETLLADSRAILQAMDSSIVAEIMSKGIVYIRNLHGGEGMGPSWQDTFETNDRNELEKICTSYGIDYEWVDGTMLRLKQKSKGIIQHRKTGELLWFNQIDQFHPSHLGDELFGVLEIIYELPERFPMFVTFGDGSAIPESFVAEILHTIETVTIAPVWKKNELLILDNELMTHGRAAYTGSRKVVVAMSE